MSGILTALQILHHKFPNAISNAVLVQRLTSLLQPRGFTANKTLLSCSFCADEVNRALEDALAGAYGTQYFDLGGLAGLPFTGRIGFAAMASHIPRQGHSLIVYGPHVGVSDLGELGLHQRRGVPTPVVTCGSAVAACHQVLELYRTQKSPEDTVESTWCPQKAADSQQRVVQALLLPHAQRLATAEHLMLELPYCLYECSDELVQDILSTGHHLIPGQVALLGGIMINTPAALSDYFLPLRLEIRNNQNQVQEDLLKNLLDGRLDN